MLTDEEVLDAAVEAARDYRGLLKYAAEPDRLNSSLSPLYRQLADQARAKAVAGTPAPPPSPELYSSKFLNQAPTPSPGPSTHNLDALRARITGGPVTPSVGAPPPSVPLSSSKLLGQAPTPAPGPSTHNLDKLRARLTGGPVTPSVGAPPAPVPLSSSNFLNQAPVPSPGPSTHNLDALRARITGGPVTPSPRGLGLPGASPPTPDSLGGIGLGGTAAAVDRAKQLRLDAALPGRPPVPPPALPGAAPLTSAKYLGSEFQPTPTRNLENMLARARLRPPVGLSPVPAAAPTLGATGLGITEQALARLKQNQLTGALPGRPGALASLAKMIRR